MNGISDGVVNECQSTDEATGETKQPTGEEMEPASEKQGNHHQEEDDTLNQEEPMSTSNVEMSMERLLQRQRSEIMFELRRLQYGDRPVTGQEQRRRTVENLVLRAVRPVSNQSAISTSRRPTDTAPRLTSSSPTIEDHRPEEILVEVSALVERRPVSSILQSLAVRRRLENSIRDVLRTTGSGVGQSHPRSGTVQARTSQPPSSGGEVRTATTGSSSASNREEDSSLHPSPAERTPSRLSHQSTGDAADTVLTAADAGAEAALSVVNVPSVENGDASGRADMIRSWIEQDVRQLRDVDLRQMYHEQFIAEVSDLIHRQLVTSALNSGFRDVLERRMRHHLDDSGIDGARVQEQLRQLPRTTGHLRNDFFDLGIMTGQQAAAAGADAAENQLDNMSVISATAAVAVPHAYTQSNAAVTRELQSIRLEIQELKNMMRLSFDLQIDIQRSIKQEVAAALSQASSGASIRLPSTSRTGDGQAPVPNGQCLICLDEQVDTVIYRCGHLCLCHICAMRLKQTGAHCPVCRAPIVDITKIYRP